MKNVPFTKILVTAGKTLIEEWLPPADLMRGRRLPKLEKGISVTAKAHRKLRQSSPEVEGPAADRFEGENLIAYIFMDIALPIHDVLAP